MKQPVTRVHFLRQFHFVLPIQFVLTVAFDRAVLHGNFAPSILVLGTKRW